MLQDRQCSALRACSYQILCVPAQLPAGMHLTAYLYHPYILGWEEALWCIKYNYSHTFLLTMGSSRECEAQQCPWGSEIKRYSACMHRIWFEPAVGGDLAEWYHSNIFSVFYYFNKYIHASIRVPPLYLNSAYLYGSFEIHRVHKNWGGIGLN